MKPSIVSRSALSAAALSVALLGTCAASPGNESTAEPLDDMAITTEVEAGLLGGEGIWSSDIIRVETIEGVVHLRGYATTERDRQRAGEVARSVAGVKQVDNRILVR